MDSMMKTMLTLAAITYRGVNLVLPEQLKRARLRSLMDECMGHFSLTKDKWKIVWGPASFNATSPGLDDALMYVAQNVAEPHILAIAIRGTNPISVSDWVFGDLMVTRQAPWIYGDPKARKDAMISISAAFGLGILQHLRWTETDKSVPSPLSPAPIAHPEVSGAPAEHASFENWIGEVKARLSAEVASSLNGILETNLNSLKHSSFNPLSWLAQHVTDTSLGNGTNLKEFLRAHVSTHPESHIYVTGHSKGGGLASTLALWLCDTQGPQPDDPVEEWDNNDPRSAVHCYSFAAPTAGNVAFVDHSDASLHECHRIWNTKDIVPYAFVADRLTELSRLYGLDGLEQKFVDSLTRSVSDAVRTLNYRQICGSGTELACELIPKLPFLLQIIHQHLDSYLEKFDLIGEMSAGTLLAPVL